MNFLYTLIIFPLVQIIELCYLFVYRVSHNPGAALFGVSMAVSALTLPLYFRAEKWQEAEREIQKRLAPKIAKIKAAFKGDEQYLILSTYYRQNHYHPVYAMRNTFSLLIQIPFFIAAYSYLSRLEALKGASFLFIRDLGAPDALIPVGGGINLLPILMTLINCVSGAIYARGLAVKDKVQIYGMAAVFLVLLYNSPAGLVLYWTLNNGFSLIKNCLQKIKHSKKILYYAVIVLAAGFDIYIFFFHGGLFIKRLLIAAVCTIFLVFMILGKHIKNFYKHTIANVDFQNTVLWHTRTFVAAAVTLFLLTGLVIPASLIASSVGEFAFIEPYRSPFPFIGNTLLQGAGFFLFWCPLVYFFFSKKVKTGLTAFLVLLSLAALINTFVFSGDYGFLTPTLKFSNASAFSSERITALVNVIVLIAAIAGCAVLLLSRRRFVFHSVQAIIIISLAALGIGNLVKIHIGFSNFVAVAAKAEYPQNTAPGPVYHLSKNGKNVIVIMLDRAISGYVPYIFEERPDLHRSFSGFTWYPNCVSLGGYTLVGAPALFGGYEYSPEEMQRRNTELLVKKYNEALLVLPRLFSENEFSITITDPSWANFGLEPDLRIYESYPKVHAENLYGRFSAYWLKNHPDVQILSISALLKNNLMHFAFFKIAPVFFREVLYDKGEWLVTTSFIAGNSEITQLTLDNYSLLDMLPEITAVDDSETNTYTALVNDLTHEPAFFQPPDYMPSNTITNKGSGPFAGEDNYHVNMAAMLLLGKWFDHFKRIGVYDNTRIIIVSDHGWYINTALNDFILPNGTQLVNFNPILLVKDFQDDTQSGLSELKTDYTFMSHADVPYLASRDITPAVNPFTGKPLLFDKSNGITISTAHAWESPDLTKYTWKIRPDEWLHVHTNIFDPANWEKVEK